MTEPVLQELPPAPASYGSELLELGAAARKAKSDAAEALAAERAERLAGRQPTP